MESKRQSIDQDIQDMGASERQSLERILGRPLDAGERIYIMAYHPANEPSQRTKNAAFDRIDKVLDEAHANATRQGISDQEADDAVEEAIEQIRHPKP